MRKIITIIICLMGMGSASAQTPQKYTGRLDSIVTITDASQKEQKQAFCYIL